MSESLIGCRIRFRYDEASGWRVGTVSSFVAGDHGPGWLRVAGAGFQIAVANRGTHWELLEGQLPFEMVTTEWSVDDLPDCVSFEAPTRYRETYTLRRRDMQTVLREWKEYPGAKSIALAMRAASHIPAEIVEAWAEKHDLEIGSVHTWRRMRRPGRPLNSMDGKQLGEELKTLVELAPAWMKEAPAEDLEALQHAFQDLQIRIDELIIERKR